MNKIQWTSEDFSVFQINGLSDRMDALTSIIRPKFHQLGEVYSSYFSAQTGDEFFPHVAKHARRTVNPPQDSWVAYAPYKRGYKALPHFQIGLWGTHLFIVTAIIYEAPQKQEMAQRLLNHLELFDALSDDYIVSGDHMSPDAITLAEARDAKLEQLITRLRDVKKGEFLVGRHIAAEDAIKMSPEKFTALTEETFDALLPIYNVIIGK
ncbi:YktB family protein [Solibacillus sp. FSL H8-0538]|uniref:YktB family protein n=1 Tax=Solibacillus sp. FSL H8-0538 TaxID=2921400 RepID=UPI0030FB19A5